MIQIQYKKINTEFQYPFTSAHGLKTHQPAFLIALTFNGVTGFGEAPAIHYYNITVDKMEEDLLAKISILQSYSFNEPSRFHHFIEHLYEGNSFLICALDMAYWDMYAQVKRKKIHEILGIEWKNIPPTDYTIGIDTIENMLQKIDEHPMPIYKIKVNNSHDLNSLRAIRKHTDSILRIDANASWDFEHAINILPELEAMNIELIEQPLAKENYAQTKILAQATTIPIIADESCVSPEDLIQCIGTFDGINIKLTKCGGITPAFEMIQEAKKNNLKVMIGNMNETEMSTYATAQFLPLLDYVDMDGPLLLKIPELKRLQYENATIHLIN